MNESEQRFDDLRQLLKLKQHEIPPPGYFHGFSSQVISAIQEDLRVSSKPQNSSSPSWLSRFFASFDSRPGLVGGLATSMVLFLVLGIVLADHSDTEMAANYSVDANIQPSSSPLAELSAPDQSGGGIAVSTNPPSSLQPASSIFGQDNSLFQMASYAPVGAAGH